MEKRVRLTSIHDRKIIFEATMVTDENKEISFKDFAFTRSGAIQKVSDLGYMWMKHAKKVSDDPKSMFVLHWVGEMRGWWNTVVMFKLKSSNDFIPMSLIYDYFLDGYMFDFKNRDLFNSRMVALGNKEITTKELMGIIKETILKG